MSRSAETYDVFLSYARSDDASGAVTDLHDAIVEMFYRRTGRNLHIFFDRRQIRNAQLWSERISSALQTSAVLICIVTPKYFASKWCRKEWIAFTGENRGRSGGAEFGRIFPVCLNGQPSISTKNATIQNWARSLAGRQYTDLAGTPARTEKHAAIISRLLDDLIRVLEHTDSRDAGPGADIFQLDVTTGYVRDRDRYIGLLEDAANITIVGMTSEALAKDLGEALDRRRANLSDPKAFWSSVRVVSLANHLLVWLKDEQPEYPSPEESLIQRRLAADRGRHSVSVLLGSSPPSQWALYDARFYLPFTGTLFEMPNGSTIVQLVIRYEGQRSQGHRYLEYDDTPDHYFKKAFDHVVNESEEDQRIVLVGSPHDKAFRWTGRRFRDKVLVDGSRETGWLPVVLVITWWNRDGQAELLLELRTRYNARRELDRLSHLSSYVYERDVQKTVGHVPQVTETDLQAAVPEAAALRRVRLEVGDSIPGELQHVENCRYIYEGKESLFFYVYSLEIPSDLHFPRHSEICRPSIEDLLALREHQALRNAERLCQLISTSRDAGNSGPKVPDSAIEICALNLTVHDRFELGRRLTAAAQSKPADSDLELLATDLGRLVKQTQQTHRSVDQLIQVAGLPGMQYRFFFTTLLQLYEDLDINGAPEMMANIKNNPVKRNAVARLSSLYRDEVTMSRIPAEI